MHQMFRLHFLLSPRHLGRIGTCCAVESTMQAPGHLYITLYLSLVTHIACLLSEDGCQQSGSFWEYGAQSYLSFPNPMRTICAIHVDSAVAPATQVPRGREAFRERLRFC